MSRDRVPVSDVRAPESLDAWLELATEQGLFFRLERLRTSELRWRLEIPEEGVFAQGPALRGVLKSVFRMWLQTNDGEAFREQLAARPVEEPTEFARAAHGRFTADVEQLIYTIEGSDG